MSYKDILLYLDDGASNPERVNTGLRLAQQHQARLTGVSLSASVPRHLKVRDARTRAGMAREAAEKRAADFEQAAARAGVEAASLVIDGDAQEAAKRLAQCARNYDLALLRQANPKSRNLELMEKVAEQAILLSGRPILFMPYIGAHRMPCQRAFIAWDGTPAATRALHDAIPLLKNIPEVVLLVVQEGKPKTQRGELLCEGMVEHLGRHGVEARSQRTHTGSFDVPTVILNQIAEHDADLLVMGGYGTPSLKQKIFGGVTRTLLSSMIVPVFMSH
jgi:nucleotide-binding universal stress UspA family protein